MSTFWVPGVAVFWLLRTRICRGRREGPGVDLRREEVRPAEAEGKRADEQLVDNVSCRDIVSFS